MTRLFLKLATLTIAVCLPLWVYVFFFPTYVLHQESANWFFTDDVIHGRIDQPENKILVIGDSRIMAGVLPKKFPDKAVSIALGGVTPVEAYYSLKTYLENNTKPKIVLLSFAPVHMENRGSFRERTLKFNFLNYPMFKEFIEEKVEHGQEILEDISLFTLYMVRYPLLYIPEFQKAVLKPRNRLNRKLYNYRVTNYGHVSRGTRESVSEAALEEEASRQSFSPDPVNDVYLKKILFLASVEKIQLAFTTLPMNHSTRMLVKEQYQAGFRLYLQSAFAGFPSFKYEADFKVYPDDCFGDSSHLNLRGADRFTEYIKTAYLTPQHDLLAAAGGKDNSGGN